MSDNRRRLLITSQNRVGVVKLIFPVYLVEGDNGEIGRELYKYIINKYPGNTNSYTILDEEIFISNLVYPYIYGITYNGASIYFSNHRSGYVLEQDGNVEAASHSGGEN